MKKMSYVIISLIAVAVIAFLIINLQPKKSGEVCINNQCFQVEIAKTPIQKTIGLMNRTQLDENNGMLFLFSSERKHTFWMKGTKIPLDIIWIDKNKKISHIHHNARPCPPLNCSTITPENPGLYVLEINGNLSRKHGFKEGDDVKIRI